jgi:ComF family protein
MPYPLQKYISGLSALLFPVICKGCGETLNASRPVLCRACESNLPRTYFEDISTNPVVHTFWGRVKLEYATSMFYYRKAELLQSLIHHLKYKRGKETGIYLGSLTGKLLNKSTMMESSDLILPVPLHVRKQKTRGYNQAALLAEGIRSVTQLPVLSNAVIRSVHSRTQTRRSRYERWQNVEGIFNVVWPDLLENKHVLIVDDILTTGATIEAMCQALSKVPGIKISVLTLGYASG